ncbi:hypothetical protein Ahy_B02g057179 isoform A [Arachis hypogaea]|uniref:Uncharacterized protein n=1 Tax=Arachis hypogaea TaxID=3818 RepID=A0A445AB67_ARAHY|nr:hypothetical protein Ahy_B02g057179 isoform A [Arachis hypogaea]
MYEQSELIERELEQMTEQIKFIIQSLNSNQGGELDALDGMTPLDAVVRILNNQLTSLMWIDEKVSIFHHAIVWWNFLLLLLVSAVILINPSRAEEFSSRIQKLANQGSASDRELTGYIKRPEGLVSAMLVNPAKGVLEQLRVLFVAAKAKGWSPIEKNEQSEDLDDPPKGFFVLRFDLPTRHSQRAVDPSTQISAAARRRAVARSYHLGERSNPARDGSAEDMTQRRGRKARGAALEQRRNKASGSATMQHHFLGFEMGRVAVREEWGEDATARR